MTLPQPTQHALNVWQSLPQHSDNDYRQRLVKAITQKWSTPHGNLPTWQAATTALHKLIKVDQAYLRLGDCIVLDTPERVHSKRARALLMQLHPWRKGPWQFAQQFIDSEWQCQLKWQRIMQANIAVHNAHILDIGCANGYFAYRMMQAGATSVVGVESSLLMHFQFQLFKHYAPELAICLLPIRFEQLPAQAEAYDMIFCMGVLYHQKQPLQHLHNCWQRLRPGGALILETLLITDALHNLYPGERYAKMRNVYIVPTQQQLQQWLQQAGFSEVRVHDISITSSEEQRQTAWMTNQSLAQFLNHDGSRSIEGYPPPTRILLQAQKS